MDRRTFALLSGSVAAGLWRPAPIASRVPPAAGGRLRFQLDELRRWSLWYHGPGQPVPLLRGAALGAWIGDRLVFLSDLEDTVSGTRRPPGGDAVVVRGRAAGVYIEAEFFSGEDAAAPQAAITLSVYPERTLPSVRGVRFWDVALPDLIPGEGPLLAQVNGYHSWSMDQVLEVTDGLAETPSHGALGLTRRGRGLGVAFDAGEPGEARVTLAGSRCEARSDWLPARPVRVQGDASTVRFCYTPDGDGLEALRGVFAPRSVVDRDRLAATLVPAGWCSWYELFGNVTEDAVVANLEFCATHFDRRHLRIIQLDDGYQKATGDWGTNAKFPHGHRWLTNRIHAAGFDAGLWTAPFAVTDRSGVPAAHPDWLLRDEQGPAVWDTRDDWGGRVYALDGAHPGVQTWLTALARRVTREWGYDYLKIDFLLWATRGLSHYGGATHAEAYRQGLAALRAGLGGAFLLGCGAPLQHAVGAVDGMRIGGDVDASWSGIQGPARAAALRSFYHRSAWLNDPDCLVVRPPLSLDEAQAWAAIVAVSGGMTLLSDNLPALPVDRIPILQRTLPVAPVAAGGRALDTASLEREVAPAILRGTMAYPLAGTWRFAAGDEAAFAAPDLDDAGWTPVTIPGTWPQETTDGFGWYRGRVTLPARPAGAADLVLELGKIDDVDETFLNGVRIGATGSLPPDYHSAWDAFRRYPIPADLVRWGGENVVAIRVYDGGGPGGYWSTRRAPPPGTWITQGAPGWWTGVFVNWEDEPRDISIPLANLGIAETRCRAYDVWRDTPLPDVVTRIAATLAPHTSLTLSLRGAAPTPQIVGTTRHVVQGAVDVLDETWDPATRTLSARAVNLDARPYRVTIAVPRTLRPGDCTATPPCAASRLDSGHVVLAWPGGNGGDLRWALPFVPSS